MKSSFFCRAGLVLGLLSLGNLAGAIEKVIIETDFTAAQGYADAKLQFQGDAATGGTWLGQVNADTGTPVVDSTGTGTVSHTGEGFFLRNLFNQGATGGVAGGDGSNEAGNGFNIGDTIEIEYKFSFELVDGTGNHQMASIGVREDFVNGGFNASPQMGAQYAYSPFENGTLKFFTNIDRAGFNGADNAFAFFVSSAEAGIDNGFEGPEPIDLVSDNLMLTWTTEYMGNDTWKSTEMIFENLDQAITKQASVDNPDSLEEITYTGTEAFLGLLHVRGSIGSTQVTDALKFTYNANVAVVEGDFDEDGDVDGADFLKWQQDGLSLADLQAWQTNYAGGPLAGFAAVPEPTAVVLGLMGIVLGGGLLRKRS